MEAYSHVYVEPQELTEDQVWEEVESWVNSLLEEGYDLSEYTWEEMYEAYVEQLNEAPMTAFQAAGGNAKLAQLNKGRGPRSGRVTAANIEKQGQDNLFKAGGGQAAISAGGTKQGPRSSTVNKLNRQDIINRGTVAAGAKPAKPGTPAKPTTPAKPAATTAAAKPTTPAKPAATTAAPKPTTPTKPAATTAAPKPTTPTKPAGSAMDQWAKANPKLAAAKAERDRTRGTSATTNPLMKDTKSSLPAPKSPTPSTAKTGFDLAKKGVNLAAGVDIFDLVKGHLLDEGYAETEEGAMVIMVNMSEEWRQSILDACSVEIYNQVYELDEAGKNDARIRGNIKSFGSNYTPPRDWDQSANRGQGAVLNAKQKEKQRRKSLRKEDLESWVAESQYARENPEKYERSPEAREGRRRRSGINDPKTGINSPAFAAFMAQQMGGKKKKD
jgi:hypothetical protein